jgi:hypothetical protein
LFKLLALGSLLLPVFAACGDDEDDSDTEEPMGPPSIRITGFIGADHRVAERADENAVDVCRNRLGVVVDIPADTWTLRPPGRCGETAQCGYVAITLDPESDASIGVNSINLTTMLDLTGGPVFGSEGGTGGEGAGSDEPVIGEGLHRVRVELRNDDGTVFLDATSAAVADEADVDLSFVDCPSSGEGSGSGGGGAGGQPGTAGASAGGAGGSAEGGAAGSGDGVGGQGGDGVGGLPAVSGAAGGG